MDVLYLAVPSLLVGLVVGLLSGMLGIGGGTILVPVFKLGYAMSAIASTATSLFTVIPTSVSGAIAHVRNKTCLPKLGIAMGIAGALTSPFGVWLASISPDWLIMLMAAIAIGYSSVTMLMKALRRAPAKSGEPSASQAAKNMAAKDADAAGESGTAANALSTAAAGESNAAASSAVCPAQGVEVTRRMIAMGALIGLIAGVASGYVGLGGGFLMVPLMLQLLHTPMKVTSGTSLIAIMILAVPGVVMQALLGNVNWVAGIAVACGSIPGALLGAKLVANISERALRLIFGVFLLFAALILVLEEVGIV